MLTVIQLVLRHALTALGGGLVTRYEVPGSEVEVIVGGVVTAAGVAWSVWDKRRNRVK